MSAKVFWIGLVIQIIGWPLLFFGVVWFDEWRRRRAKDAGKHVIHFHLLILVLAIIYTMFWVLYPVLRWIRQEN
jgi:hypothetical protein